MIDRVGTPSAGAAPDPPASEAGPADRVGTPSTGGAPESAAPAAAAQEPDPAAVDDAHPWAEADRPRGLDAWFAPGGEDDAPPERIADERRLTRLLVLMLALLIGIPLLLTAIAFIGELAAMRGG